MANMLILYGTAEQPGKELLRNEMDGWPLRITGLWASSASLGPAPHKDV